MYNCIVYLSEARMRLTWWGQGLHQRHRQQQVSQWWQCDDRKARCRLTGAGPWSMKDRTGRGVAATISHARSLRKSRWVGRRWEDKPYESPILPRHLQENFFSPPLDGGARDDGEPPARSKDEDRTGMGWTCARCMGCWGPAVRPRPPLEAPEGPCSRRTTASSRKAFVHARAERASWPPRQARQFVCVPVVIRQPHPIGDQSHGPGKQHPVGPCTLTAELGSEELSLALMTSMVLRCRVRRLSTSDHILLPPPPRPVPVIIYCYDPPAVRGRPGSPPIWPPRTPPTGLLPDHCPRFRRQSSWVRPASNQDLSLTLAPFSRTMSHLPLARP
nr:hypothetical protein CFP56_03907 [Quercus suber]